RRSGRSRDGDSAIQGRRPALAGHRPGPWSSGRRRIDRPARRGGQPGRATPGEDGTRRVPRRGARWILPHHPAPPEEGAAHSRDAGPRRRGGRRIHLAPGGRGGGFMRRGLRVGGHPLHAAVSDFPVVLLLLWVLLDGTALVLGSPSFWALGHWALI